MEKESQEHREDAIGTLNGSRDLEQSDEKARPLKLDKSGLPLVPQPSDHKDDPLVGHSSRMICAKG